MAHFWWANRAWRGEWTLWYNHNICFGKKKKKPRLALLSKVICEFSQFVQIMIVDSWLRAGQGPQHVRLQRIKRDMIKGYSTVLFSQKHYHWERETDNSAHSPYKRLAHTAFPQGPPSMSSRRRSGLPGSTGSKSHLPGFWGCLSMALVPSITNAIYCVKNNKTQ